MLDRLVKRTRLSWYGFVGLVSGLLIFLAIGTASLDGTLGEFFTTGDWRDALMVLALNAYMLAILPPLKHAGESAIQALRPLVPLDDDDFDRLLSEATVATPKGELIAFGIGIAPGLLGNVVGWTTGGNFSWMDLYFFLGGSLVGGLLVWEIYLAMSGTKPFTVIHQHLSNIDIFALRPFEPIGRHGLVSALAFVGGGAIAAFFSYAEGEIFAVGNLITYGTLILISVMVFFLTMRGTHRVLDAAKDEELETVQLHIADAYRSLADIPIGSPDISALAAKLNLWKEYETRVKAARTWPYNLRMLRTLGLSVLTPVALNVAQRLIGMLFS
jgi:hypothetical protein